jgi:TolB-like protein
VDRIIRHCLEKKPEDRFQSARDLAFDLKIVSSDTSAPEAYRVGRRRHLRASLLLAVGTGVVVVGALLVGINPGGWRDRFLAPRESKGIESLAVLPFVNAGSDPDTAYLSDEIPASIINTLSRLSNLRVIPRPTAFRYRGRDADVRTVGRELRVAAVLTGQVTLRGEDLFIRVDLSDVTNDRQLWGERYDEKLADILTIEQDVAKQISDALRLELTVDDRTRLAKRHTENTEAHMAYLQGRFWWNQRTTEGLERAIDFFDEAIQEDPEYALAHAGIAEFYVVLPLWSVLRPREAYPKAEEAATRALELDNTLAGAHVSLACVAWYYDWDWAEAERRFKEAIRLDPGYATAHQWYAEYLGAMGRHDEARAEIQRALELDPLSVIIYAQASQLSYWAREYDEAIEHCRRGLEIDPDFPAAHQTLAQPYRVKGMYDQAIAEFLRSRELGGTPTAVGYLGHAYAEAGREAEAREALAELQELATTAYVGPDLFALIHLGLGDHDQAFVWLEKAYEERAFGLMLLKMDQRYDPLRGDPRFDDLLRRIGLDASTSPEK